jgi:hypothetical protein
MMSLSFRIKTGALLQHGRVSWRTIESALRLIPMIQRYRCILDALTRLVYCLVWFQLPVDGR